LDRTICVGTAPVVPGVLSSIESCIPALRRYAFALVRKPQDAEDLVHDTLVRALDKLHTRRHGEVRPWLFAIMHNLFVSQIRRSRLRSRSESLDEVSDTAPSLPGGQEERLRCRDMVEALRCLPLEQRTVVLLVSVEGMSYAEVSRVLGIPIGTVMSRLSRGRERLRQITEGEESRPCLRRVK